MDNLSILPNDNISDEPPAPPPIPKWALVEALAKAPTYQKVKVVDIEMSFGSMVIFMVKWAFAAIPAVIMIFGICLFILAALTAGGYGVGSMLSPTK
jgi:ABC-type Na+ efflux pump permease subunit